MFMKNGQTVAPNAWVEYGDFTTQPMNATPDQLVLMGVTVVADPPPPPPPPPAVPAAITDRQFFQQLSIMGLVTQDEAIQAVSIGALPAALAALVNKLPVDQQFGANMLLKGEVVFHRDHPMVPVIASLFGWTDAQTDQLWIDASKL